MSRIHPDIKKLNKKDPPPKGHKHPTYEVSMPTNALREGEYSVGEYSVAYLNNGKWNMPVRMFKTEREAFSFILDKLYYGDD